MNYKKKKYAFSNFYLNGKNMRALLSKENALLYKLLAL